MMRWARQYLKFSRAERMGLFALCLVMIFLIIAKAIAYLWPVHQPDKALVAKLQAMRLPSRASFVHMTPLPEHQDKGGENSPPLPDTVDINTADSLTLVRLVGVGPKTGHNILKRRATKGPFTSVNQLREVGSFTEETLSILVKHLRFASPLIK